MSEANFTVAGKVNDGPLSDLAYTITGVYVSILGNNILKFYNL